MSAVPRRAAFDDLRVGQWVAWVEDTPTPPSHDQVHAGRITAIHGREVTLNHERAIAQNRTGSWTILRDPPAPPVQVRREDYDTLVEALDVNSKTFELPSALFAAARTLIDNADLGDT